jgi:hypothetical protein
MLPFTKTIVVLPNDVMKQKRDIILGYYHETKQQLMAIHLLHSSEVIGIEHASDYARPIATRFREYRQWLDDYTLSLLTSEQELKNECDLNALESTLGSAE